MYLCPRPCPEGAECPGGDRVWALRGYWNQGEKSGYVVRCNFPAEERCLGGQVPECGFGYTGEVCAECSTLPRHYENGGRCLPCDGEAKVIANANSVFILVSTIVLVLAPRLIAFAVYKAFVIVGLLVKSSGSVSDNPKVGKHVRVFVNIFQLFSLDVQGTRPECQNPDDNLFSTKFWLTLKMMFDYMWPSICILLLLNTPGYLLSHWGPKRWMVEQLSGLSSVKKLKPRLADQVRWRLADVQRWLRWRLLAATVMWLDMFLLMVLTISVKGVACILSPISGPDGAGSFVLMTQPSIPCWSRDHLPVFLASLMIGVSMGIVYPIVWFLYLKQFKTLKIMNTRRVADKIGFKISTFTPSGLQMGVLLLYMDKAVVAVSDVLQNLILQAVLRCLINVVWLGFILKTSPFQNKLFVPINIVKYILVGALVLMKVAF